MIIERHPLEPFLPTNAQILMLGSFPPPISRWSINFFYPNFINDMWRIWGLLFFNDKNFFVCINERKFDYEKIVSFCSEHGIAIYDTAHVVCRQKDNASDKFLEVIEPTDIKCLLDKIPYCKAIVTTGEKATDTLVNYFKCEKPSVGNFVSIKFENRTLLFYRMPSSSRAYPMTIDKKADAYRVLIKYLI